MVPVSSYMELKAQRKQQQQMSLLLWNSVKSFSSCFSNSHHLTLLELPFVPCPFLNPAQIIAVDHKLYLSALVLQTLYDS